MTLFEVMAFSCGGGLAAAMAPRVYDAAGLLGVVISVPVCFFGGAATFMLGLLLAASIIGRLLDLSGALDIPESRPSTPPAARR